VLIPSYNTGAQVYATPRDAKVFVADYSI